GVGTTFEARLAPNPNPCAAANAASCAVASGVVLVPDSTIPPVPSGEAAGEAVGEALGAAVPAPPPPPPPWRLPRRCGRPRGRILVLRPVRRSRRFMAPFC